MVRRSSSFYMVDQSGAVKVSRPGATLLMEFRQQAMEMSVFNVGPGEVILLRLQESGILVDCGAKVIKCNAALGQAVRSYLVEQGVRLIAIVASHPHVDHLNGLESLLTGDVAQVLAPGAVYYHNGETMGSWLTDTLGARLAAMGSEVLQQVAVQNFGHYPGLGGMEMTMFVDGRWRPRPAYRSIVMSVPYREARFLLTGDIYISYEDKLLATSSVAPYLSATVLKITHHGSEHGTGKNFLGQAVPRIAAASTAGDAGHRLERQVKRRLKPYTSAIFDTYGKRGDITVRTDGVRRIESGRQGVLYQVEMARPTVLDVAS